MVGMPAPARTVVFFDKMHALKILTVVDGYAVQAVTVFDLVRPSAARDRLPHVDGSRRQAVSWGRRSSVTLVTLELSLSERGWKGVGG